MHLRNRTLLTAILATFVPWSLLARSSDLPDETDDIVEALVANAPGVAVIGVGQAASAEGSVTRLSVRIAELFEEGLVKRAGKAGYRVVERAGLEELSREWALGQSGAVEEQTAAAAGKLSGASHFVFGSYTTGDERLTVRARLVDAESGSILASESAELRMDDEIEALVRAPIQSPAPAANTRPADALSVELWTDKDEYRCGDTLRFSVRANRDCYLTLIDINPRGEAIVIYPNAYERTGRIPGGTTTTIPTENMGFDFIVEPPTGAEVVRAIVSAQPLASVKDVLARISDDTPFVQPADLVGLTRGIRVEGKKASPDSWADTAVRFRTRR